MSQSPRRRVAVIDIGSNAVRLQIGALVEGRLMTEVFTRIPLGLGGSIFGGRARQIARRERRCLAETVLGMRHLIAGMKPCRYSAVATAALRGAANRQQVIDEVYRGSGVRIRVLSGYQEAAMIGSYIASHFPAAKAVVNADIGGGSTDCALLANGRLLAGETFALGTARADGGSAAEKERCRQWLRQYCPPPAVVTSSGGSATELQACCGAITRRHLLRWRRQISGLSVAELAHRYQMQPDRAAHIEAALDIYLLILGQGIKRIEPVRGGLSEALIWHRLCQAPRR